MPKSKACEPAGKTFTFIMAISHEAPGIFELT